MEVGSNFGICIPLRIQVLFYFFIFFGQRMVLLPVLLDTPTWLITIVLSTS